MIANVCTSSTETQFGLMSDLLFALGSTASAAGMDKALTDATAWAERYITNSQAGSIRRSVVRETLAGRGSQQLMVSRLPVIKVVRLFDSTDTGNATEYCSTSFRLESPESGFITLTNDAGFAWDYVQDQYIDSYPRPSQVYRRWLVEYEAGWQFACSSSTGEWESTTTGRTLPEDVERAVVLKAAEFYDGGRPLEMMRVGPLQLSYRNDDDLDPAERLLAQYRSLE